MEDDYGDPLNSPDEYLYLLQDEEIDRIENVFAEAYLYAIEGKCGKPEQPDLFEAPEEQKAETPEEPAENDFYDSEEYLKHGLDWTAQGEEEAGFADF